MQLTTISVFVIEAASLLFMTIMLIQFHRIHSRRMSLLVSLGMREKFIQSAITYKHILIIIYGAMTVAMTFVSLGIALYRPHLF